MDSEDTICKALLYIVKQSQVVLFGRDVAVTPLLLAH